MSAAAGEGGDGGSSRLILVLGVVGFASAFSMRAVDPMVPLLADTFARDVATVALLATGFSLAYALGQPILGPVGDALGKARTILVSTGLMCVALLACAFAAGFEALLGLRIVTGFVAGGIIPLALAAIGDRIGIEARSVAIARFIVFVILGQMAGAAVSGIVAETFGWRTVFLGGAAVASLALLLSARDLRPRPDARRTPLTPAGMIAGYRPVFANPTALGLYALVALEGAAVFGLFPYVASFLQARAGTGATEAGAVIGGFGAGGIAFGFVVGALLRRLGTHAMLRGGGALMAASLALFVLPKPWALDIATMFAFGLGFYMLHNAFQTAATEIAPAARGSAMAAFAGSFFLGHAIGPVAVGQAGERLGYETAFVGCGLALLAVALLAARVIAPKATPA